MENTLEDPIAQFQKWFEEADREASGESNAMTLSTVDERGYPCARVVLLKRISPEGFLFFTNYKSRKAEDIEGRPRVCLSFFWHAMERQVCIAGRCHKTSASVSDSYFSTRPRGSQLSAWVSPQSERIASREALEEARSGLQARFEGRVIPRPPHWGGYLVRPERIEFWQGRPDRLHDRILYIAQEGTWQRFRLAP